jgi:hypothetical protein
MHMAGGGDAQGGRGMHGGGGKGDARASCAFPLDTGFALVRLLSGALNICYIFSL